jgi:hypothetical protein
MGKYRSGKPLSVLKLILYPGRAMAHENPTCYVIWSWDIGTQLNVTVKAEHGWKAGKNRSFASSTKMTLKDAVPSNRTEMQ